MRPYTTAGHKKWSRPDNTCSTTHTSYIPNGSCANGPRHHNCPRPYGSIHRHYHGKLEKEKHNNCSLIKNRSCLKLVDNYREGSTP